MTDLRALCARMADELDHYRQLLMDDRRETHALAAEARAALAQPEPQGLVPEVDDILPLAAIIRRVDGNHDKGAAALAEAILSYPDSRWQHAQPEPQGPTDEEPTDQEIEEWADAAAEVPLEEMDPEVHGWRRCFKSDEFSETIRAALRRWGRPAIEPVPVSERLPGPEDCDAEGCCWAIGKRGHWMCVHAIGRSWSNPIYTHWLPHWALPVPGVEGGDD